MLLLVAGTVTVSFSAVFVRLLADQGVAPTTIGVWRMLVSSVAFFLMTLARSRKLILPQAKGALLWAGSCFALDLFCWHRSIVIVGVGVSTLLASTQVFWVAVVALFVFGERIQRRQLLSALVGVIGLMLLCLRVTSGVSSRWHYGVLLGLVTGLAYAGYIAALKKSGSNAGPATLRLTWITAVSGLTLLVAALSEGVDLLPPTPVAAALLAALALLPQTIGWFLIDRGLRRLSANSAALLLLVQPVMAFAWGAGFFDERLAGVQVCGAVLTLAAIALGSTQSASAALPSPRIRTTH